MKKLLKQSFIGKILYFIRDFYRFPFGRKIINSLKQNKNIIILLGTPTFNNIGDHLIAVSALKFLNDIFPYKTIIEIPTQFYISNKSKLSKIIDKNIPVFIMGGGWMGNIWEKDEYIMQDMIKTFSNNKIIILPQTVYYDQEINNYQTVLADAKKTYSSCKKLLIFFRDKASYDFGVKEFFSENVKICLAPDIALYGKYNFKRHSRKNILLCLRKDREGVDSNLASITKQFCQENNINIIFKDTVIKWSIPIWKRNKVINKIINCFSKSEIIITNRLHGMIFAFLTNSKCLAFDNRTKKVSGVYNQWLKNNKNIVFMDYGFTKDDLFDNIYKLLKTNDYFITKDELTNEFNKMKNEIGGIYETKKDDFVFNTK